MNRLASFASAHCLMRTSHLSLAARQRDKVTAMATMDNSIAENECEEKRPAPVTQELPLAVTADEEKVACAPNQPAPPGV